MLTSAGLFVLLISQLLDQDVYFSVQEQAHLPETTYTMNLTLLSLASTLQLEKYTTLQKQILDDSFRTVKMITLMVCEYIQNVTILHEMHLHFLTCLVFQSKTHAHIM